MFCSFGQVFSHCLAVGHVFLGFLGHFVFLFSAKEEDRTCDSKNVRGERKKPHE
jgi:hypothetical protein